MIVAGEAEARRARRRTIANEADKATESCVSDSGGGLL